MKPSTVLPPDVSAAITVLSASKTVEDACDVLAKMWRRRVNSRFLRQRFAKSGLSSPANFLKVPPLRNAVLTTTNDDVSGRADTRQVIAHDFEEDEAIPPTTRSQRVEPAARDTQAAPPPVVDADIMRLLEVVKKGPLMFSELCDRLDMSPGKARALVERATKAGSKVVVAHDHVGIGPDKTEERIQSTGIAPVVGERQRIAVISDTHLGSKYCLRPQLQEFIHYAYERGVRDIMHPGDWLDGCYKHGLWELSHHGLEAQVQDLVETLPRLHGLRYHGITGNHDETFEDSCGLGVGPYIERAFKETGRNDVKFYGRRSAYVRVGGAVVHLWHPRGSAAYAKSYRLQKIIEKYSSGEKPHLLLVGHFHQYCHLFDRGVHAFLCPTFQGGGSAFGNSLGGAPAIGGMIMEWDLTEHGTMRRFAHEYSAYFEIERPHNVDDDTAHREEMPVR